MGLVPILANPKVELVEPSECGEKVLVVEDNPDVRSLAVSTLENLGHGVLSANSIKVVQKNFAGHIRWFQIHGPAPRPFLIVVDLIGVEARNLE